MNQNSPCSIFPVRFFRCLFLSLLISACSQAPQSTEVSPVPVKEVLATTKVLATISGPVAPVGQAASAEHKSGQNVVFSELGKGAAYISERNGLSQVVHNGQAGKMYKEVQWTTLSPDGTRIAYGALQGETWRMVVDGREGNVYDEIGMARFSPDGRHILYDARTRSKWSLVLDEKVVATCPERYNYYDKFFTPDSSKIFFIESPAENTSPFRVNVTDLAMKSVSLKEVGGFCSEVVFNKIKSRLALINDCNGKKRVIEYDFTKNGYYRENPLYDAVGYLAFGSDNLSLAYIAEKGGKRFLVLNGKEELMPEGIVREPPVIRPNMAGAGVIIDDEKEGYYYHEAFAKAGVKKKYLEAAGIIYSRDSSRYAYIAKQGTRIFMVVNGTEGMAFDMIVTPMFSPDGRYLMYRARKDGKRFVVVADADGRVLRQHPAYEQVFQTEMTADGKSVAYGVKDGKELVWKVEPL